MNGPDRQPDLNQSSSDLFRRFLYFDAIHIMADNTATKAPGLAATKHRVKSVGCYIDDLAVHPHLSTPRERTCASVGGPDQRASPCSSHF